MNDCYDQRCSVWNGFATDYKKSVEQLAATIRENLIAQINTEKEDNTMQVTYNGFTGRLDKLERKDLSVFGIKDCQYDLAIYDSEKKVAHSFAGVKLEDVKFHGGAVAFGE